MTRTLLLLLAALCITTGTFAQKGAIHQLNFSGNTEDGIGTLTPRNYGATPATDRFDAPKSAYAFDGTNDQIDLGKPIINELKKFTMAGWINVEQLTNRMSVFGQNDCAEIMLKYRTVYFWTAGGKISLKDAVSLGRWTHIATTNDGAVLKVYINGVLRAEQPCEPLSPSTFTFKVGGGVADATGAYFNGRIDDVVICDRALKAGDIQQLYEAGGYHPAMLGTNTNGTSAFKVFAQDAEGVSFTNNQPKPVTINVKADGRWKFNNSLWLGPYGAIDSNPELPFPEKIGALVVHRASGVFEHVGGQASITLEANETVHFIINDSPGDYNDNVGYQSVVVSYNP